ncbi:MAG: CDP-alcohol phosphatidyltransferase family protein [Acidobacteria bacterium]|nr:CDP-alcohol phosphatidyltransferase family protein [Acidobacteriota bacterium]
MYIVLMEGTDPRFLGGSARARHERVAARVGATLVTPDSLPALGSAFTILVPPTTALMLPFFSDPVVVHAEQRGDTVAFEAPDGARVFAGRADLVLAAADGSGGALPVQRVGVGSLLAIGTVSQRRAATRAALLATAKPSDGFVSRTFNRPISRACSRVALALGMSATAASVATLLLGFVCAWVAAQPGYLPFVLTGILFQLTSILDGVDGEIARSTLTESEAGARVDTIVDQLTYLSSFVGMTIGWVREGSGTMALWSTAVIGLALVGSLVRAGRFVARHADDASFVWIDRSVRRAAVDTGLRPLKVAAALFTLLRRDLFAVVFLGVSLTGQRILVPALVLSGVVVANLTLTIYSEQLAAAAAALRRARAAVSTGFTAADAQHAEA